ncbi:MAG: UDP-N-acetylmuramoyl-tripeptide--D-alanyl-D-alanine ligase [Algiphilus sp.]|uniref:UDP-N-acetylmuramoyl-tripeptide--D-alanyl-D- alanine ligase n=1 Tax=Algiphilus sp. TaxID=1872431 RepID=UPI0032ECAD87
MRSAAALAAAVDGRLHGNDVRFEAVVTDSRRVARGDCFFALSGPRFDAHRFVEQVADAGAALAVVGRVTEADLTQVVVDDPLTALQRFAAAWRAQFTLPLVGVTGANGKTTVRALCEAVLAPMAPVLATTGNLNNHIGVPLVLSRLRAVHRVAVIEMGANHLGEIAHLTALARPTVGVVTNSGDAHLDGFGTREAAAQGEGGELLEGLPADGIAVINADDPCVALMEAAAGGRRCLRFGIDATNVDVAAESIVAEPAQAPTGMRFTLRLAEVRVPVQLPLPGRHNVYNALAAAAAGYALGIAPAAIAEGLRRVQPVQGRLIWRDGVVGCRVLDDSYNANPDSLAAGIAVLAQSQGTRALVLGDMAELGATAEAHHTEAGRRARVAGIEHLYTAGPLAAHAATAFGEGAHAYEDAAALAAALPAQATRDWVVLVKGSRSAGMERVVQALCAPPAAGDHNNDNERGASHAVSPQ